MPTNLTTILERTLAHRGPIDRAELLGWLREVYLSCQKARIDAENLRSDWWRREQRMRPADREESAHLYGIISALIDLEADMTIPSQMGMYDASPDRLAEWCERMVEG